MVKTVYKKLSSSIIEGTASVLDDEGKGIVFSKDFGTLFVPGLLPSEKGLIRVYFDKKTHKGKECELVKRLTSSPLRVKPLCPYYEKCGGCTLMHLQYAEQLKYKTKKVQDLIHKFASLDIEVKPCIGMDNPYRFRNKVQVPVKKIKGEAVTGFYENNSHHLIPSDDCLIETEKTVGIINYIKKIFNKYKVEPYDEDRQTGFIRHILVKESRFYGEVMVVLVTASEEYEGKKNFIRLLTSRFPEIHTIVQNINPRKTNVILGQKEIIWYGNGKIKDRIFDNDFLISARSFYQTNPLQTEKLYGLVIKDASLTGKEKVLDAYSGTGTIGMSLARKAKEVTCVELEKEAVADAKKNALLNKLTNVRFVEDDCTRWILTNYEHEHFDVVILDPPRKGTTEEFASSVKKIHPDKVIYVSCNPVTLARDLNYFKDMYKIDRVETVDMFPHTSHVETVVLLSLKNVD